jgi:hypothetical protein
MIWKTRHAPRCLGVLGFTLGALLMSHVAVAEGLSVVRTVYLEHGAIVDPKAIVRARDNGFIIAGSLDRPNQPRSAWATKTDAQGIVLWRYTAPLRDKLRINDRPEFTSVAIMPDDSVFLCGRMPLPQGGTALLTHLDKNGRVLNEQAHTPAGLVGGKLTSCLAWNNGVAAIGLTGGSKHVEPTPSHPLPYEATYLYWVVFTDHDGNVIRERLIPISDRLHGFPDALSPMQSIPDGYLTFVATRNATGTQVIRLNATGDVAAATLLPKDFRIVQPMLPTENIELVSTETAELTRLTLNSKLQELRQETSAQEPGSVDVAYLRPDGSLVIFGAKHDKRGSSYLASATTVESQLKHPKSVLLGPEGESYHAKAGVPSSNPDEFVAVRSALTPSHLGVRATSEQLESIRLGVALDFIRIQ